MRSRRIMLLPLGVLLAAQLACGGSSPRVADRLGACTIAQVFIEGQLKAPSTAKHQGCYDADIKNVGNGEWTVLSYVDAENSFGAMIRTTYEMRVKWVGDGKWTLVDLQTVP